jgi:hypothetical protein
MRVEAASKNNSAKLINSPSRDPNAPIPEDEEDIVSAL